YGVYAMRSYKRNVDSIMGSFREMLPDALFLWLSALPASNSSEGGVIVPSAEYVRPIIPGKTNIHQRLISIAESKKYKCDVDIWFFIKQDCSNDSQLILFLNTIK
ncbi:unnamed protein product, partial [Rotaria magnacalcarata]